MLFRRKYVFESKKTRAIRKILNTLLMALFAFLSYSLVCLVFVILAHNEFQTAQSAFYKRPPDIIVVFTGDVGRIKFALKKAQEYNQSHILISGVGGGNTVTSLVSTDTANSDLGKMDNLDTSLLEIDYMARNTMENVVETLRYLKKNQGMKKILVISHDYHIMRIKTLFNAIKSDQDKYSFYYLGPESDYTNIRYLKILYKEVFKMVRNLGMLALWEHDS